MKTDERKLTTGRLRLEFNQLERLLKEKGVLGERFDLLELNIDFRNKILNVYFREHSNEPKEEEVR